MVYVQRNSEGQITGVYAVPQEGLDLEEMEETNPEVIAFRLQLK